MRRNGLAWIGALALGWAAAVAAEAAAPAAAVAAGTVEIESHRRHGGSWGRPGRGGDRHDGDRRHDWRGHRGSHDRTWVHPRPHWHGGWGPGWYHPAPVWAPPRWVWNGYGWVLAPGHWR